jgi:hypothetical protein
MMNAQPDGLAKWHRFVSEKDMQALSEALADDVLFRSPVLWKPKEGKATAMLYLSSAARRFGGLYLSAAVCWRQRGRPRIQRPCWPVEREGRGYHPV